MSYIIRITKGAIKELRSIPKSHYINIRKRINELEDNPYPPDCKKLKGFDNIFRIRVAAYRIIYEIKNEELIITVIKIGHRKDIYD
jgi:mRNA interferase RelE/StbE